jgi:hypothetical protein
MAQAVNRMSQNVRTKAVRMTIFLSSQDKISKGMLCRKKRLITSHKRAGLRMDDDAMDDLDDFKPLYFTRSSLSKNVLITQRKFACQIRARSLKCQKIL